MFEEASSRGLVLITTSALLQGSHGLWAKLIGLEFGAFYQGWTRSVIVLLLLIPVYLLTRAYSKIEAEDRKWYALFIFFMILSQAPLFYAYNTIGLATATLLFFSARLITHYIIGHFWLEERVTLLKVTSLIIALSGLAIIFLFSFEALAPFGMAMAILTGVVVAGEVSFTKKVTHKHSALQVTTAMWLGIFVTHLPFALLFGETITIPSLDIVWMYHTLYAVSIMIAFGLVVAGFKYVPASIGGLLGLLVIVFSSVFGVVLLQETLTTNILFGGTLIIVAAVLPQLHVPRLKFIYKGSD